MKTLVVIPTYCEEDSIQATVRGVRAHCPTADVLVVDDGSPDATQARVHELMARDDRIRLMARPGKDGLGRAYVAAFRQGLAEGYDVLVEMDADGSHRPVDLPGLLSALDQADLVIGSRWVEGGATEGWPMVRRLISKGGNRYARAVLRFPIKDSTSGFRAFDARALATCLPERPAAQGYAFQVEMAWRLWSAGFQVREAPILFRERTEGASKMTVGIAVEAAARILQWRLSGAPSSPRPASNRVPLDPEFESEP